VAREASLVVAYGLWVESWQAALAALTTARHDKLVSTREAAAHTAVIAAERELVTKQLMLLMDAWPAREMNGGVRS